MTILHRNQSIGIVALSNGLNPTMSDKLKVLERCLNSLQIPCVWPEKLFQEQSVFHATDQERAKMLMTYYQDEQIQAIFDISGGDLANGVLTYLDYDVIRANPKPFFGYSDLSVVLNAIYSQAGVPTYWYQLRHLIGRHFKLKCLKRHYYTEDNRYSSLR